MVEPNTQAPYKSTHVEERFHKKPVPQYSIGEILRIEHIVRNADQYFDKDGVIAGWARTVRYNDLPCRPERLTCM